VAAARELGQATIRAEVVVLDDAAAFRALMVENANRRPLAPVEEADQFALARDAFKWSASQIAQARGCSESHVRDRLALLKMPERVVDAVRRNVLTATQAAQLAPAVQVKGAVADILKEVEKTDRRLQFNVAEAVVHVFRTRTIELNDKTPFAWQEICRDKGCLAIGPDGASVCTSPSNYAAAVASVHQEEMASAVTEFRKNKAKSHGVTDDLPVYYLLGPAVPGWSWYRPTEIRQPAEFPACPVPVQESQYGTSCEAMVWQGHIGQVADKAGCRACPSWKGKGPGRALRVTPPSTSMYDERGAKVELLCMNARCRAKKQKEGKSAAEQREAEKQRKIDEAQAEMAGLAVLAAHQLASDRIRLLASLLVTQDGVYQPDLHGTRVGLEHEFGSTVEKLGITLPPFGQPGQPDAMSALASLGEDALLRILALRRVESISGAWDWSGRWMPKKLEATLKIVFGEAGADKLREALGGEQGKGGCENDA